jgi:hypothetical protein
MADWKDSGDRKDLSLARHGVKNRSVKEVTLVLLESLPGGDMVCNST